MSGHAVERVKLERCFEFVLERARCRKDGGWLLQKYGGWLLQEFRAGFRPCEC